MEFHPGRRSHCSASEPGRLDLFKSALGSDTPLAEITASGISAPEHLRTAVSRLEGLTRETTEDRAQTRAHE
jgi:hypothetical protein